MLGLSMKPSSALLSPRALLFLKLILKPYSLVRNFGPLHTRFPCLLLVPLHWLLIVVAALRVDMVLSHLLAGVVVVLFTMVYATPLILLLVS